MDYDCLIERPKIQLAKQKLDICEKPNSTHTHDAFEIYATQRSSWKPATRRLEPTEAICDQIGGCRIVSGLQIWFKKRHYGSPRALPGK